MGFSEVQLVQWWTTFVYPLCRVSALVAAAPVVGTRAVPARIRIALALAVTAAIAPAIPSGDWPLPWTAAGSLTVMSETCTGLALGLSLRLAFVALEICGNLIAQLMGLSFSAMVDPASGAEVPVIGQMYAVFATLLYLALDAHLALFQLLAASFRTLPIGGGFIHQDGLQTLIQTFDGVFAAGVLLALPLASALLVVNLGFGVLSRAAPQMNIFAVGLPVSALFGIGLLLLGTADLLRAVPAILDSGLRSAEVLVNR
jgi:flagellar biosynthesis protein FliR